MTQWEFKVIRRILPVRDADDKIDEFWSELENLGLDGWQMVSVERNAKSDNFTVLVWFQRPKQPTIPEEELPEERI